MQVNKVKPVNITKSLNNIGSWYNITVTIWPIRNSEKIFSYFNIILLLFVSFFCL